MHPARRSSFPWQAPAWAAAALLVLAPPSPARAHQVPSLTVEALFSADRSYVLRVSLDPRLFLSDQPSSLPPVPAEWYREQTPDQLAATRRQAGDYVRDALELTFGDTTTRLTDCAFSPMDGATNEPLGPESKEVHLLAEAKGKVPEAAASFQISLSRTANVSMILLNSFEGEMERRPNVIFPGETSRPYALNFTTSKPGPQQQAAVSVPVPPAQEPKAAASRSPGGGWMLASAALVLAGLAWIAAKKLRGRRKQ